MAEFSKLISKSSQIEAIKDQIRIRILSFGWEDLHYTWSKDGVDRSPKILLYCLIDTLIPQQLQQGIPTKPKSILPSRGDTNRATLGTLSQDIIIIDKKDID